MMQKNLKKIVCAIILYLYIYSPALQIMPFGLDKIVLALCFVFILLNGKFRKYLKLFRIELVILFSIALLSGFISFIHDGSGGDGIVMYDTFLFIEVLLVPFCLMSLFSFKWKCELSGIIIYNSIIAGCITLSLLLNPTWADIMKYQILRMPEFLTTYFSFRGFGFSDGLNFSYPVVQGLCAGFVVLGLINRKPVFLIGLVPIIISIFVNARSGIIPVGVAIVLLVLTSSVSKTLKTVIPIAVVFVIALSLYKPSDDSQLSQSLEWGMTFFDIMGDFFSGEKTENMEALSLTGTMVQLPHSFSAWIIGEGVNLFGNSSYKDYGSSDIGYCIRLVYGGIVYMSLWLTLWIVMFRRLFKANKEMALLLFISLIYLNWKSDFFIVTASCRFFFFIYASCIMDPSFMKTNGSKVISKR